MLHGWIDQMKLIVIKLRTVNIYTTQEIVTYSKYPNKALKTLCTSLVMLIA